jgi:hypothetical protein
VYPARAHIARDCRPIPTVASVKFFNVEIESDDEILNLKSEMLMDPSAVTEAVK